MSQAINGSEAKRGVLQRAAKFFDTTELARRLNVSLALLEAWMRGDTTMPDGKWMDLARVLDRISREQRAMGRSGS